jgi:hypothetical protein
MRTNELRKWIYADKSELEVWAPSEHEALDIIRSFLGAEPDPRRLVAARGFDYREWLH